MKINSWILSAWLALPGALFAQARPEAGPKLDTVDAFLRFKMQQLRIPGLQIAVVRHGRIVLLHSYGLANVENAVPVTDQTVFSINSCTKAFTGVALMQLVEAGKLDLSAPVSRYLDDLPVAWRTVTIRQLASHISGLPDIRKGDGLIDASDDPEVSWVKVQTLPTEFAPGERESYNQTNYLLLSKIISKLSEEPFTQFITQNQFEVVSMPRTAQSGFSDSSDVVMNSARTYTNLHVVDGSTVNAEKLSVRRDLIPPFLLAGSGMDSTAKEVALWLIALQQGKLLRSSASLATLWTPATLNNGKHGKWGIGWPVVERPEHRAIDPNGGARSAFALYPDDDLAIVILTNLSGASPEEFIDEVAAYYVPEMHAATGFGFPPAVKAFHVAVIQHGGYQHAMDVVSEERKGDGGFQLTEEDLRALGFHLWAISQRDNAFLVFRLNARLHPDSAATYDTLAAAYTVNGEPALAKQNHERAQELKGKK